MDLRRRIRRDARLLADDPEAAALHECLVEHLFDPDLDETFLARVCGATRRVRGRLAARVGTLWAYVTELRMIEAKRRVLETAEPVAGIARRLGYRVPRTFRRAFVKAHGATPRELRRAARDATPEPPADDETREAGFEDDARLAPGALAARSRRRLVLGLLDREAVGELRARLRRRHPRLDEAPAGEQPPAYVQHPVILTPTGDTLEEVAAAHVFGKLFELPEDELRFALVHGVHFGTPAAFQTLHRLCGAVVPDDGERAMLIAELAVQMIEPHRRYMGETADQWKAMAWTLLGRVQAMAGHDGGAERSLGFALAEVGEDALEPWVEIEVRRLEGMLRVRQRRYREAARALDRAADLGRGLDRSNAERFQVVLERLELASALGDVETGLALLEEIRELNEAHAGAGGDRATFRRCVALYHGARLLAAGGDHGGAETCLREARLQLEGDPEGDADGSLGVLWAFVTHDLARAVGRGDPAEAETHLRSVLERYRRFRVPVYEAAAEAELAVVCALRGRRAEARRLAASAAAFLDDLPLHREAWNAARRLRALADGGADAPESELTDVLAALRRDLDLVRWEVTANQARPAALARWGKA